MPVQDHLIAIHDGEWRMPQQGAMKVPGAIFADQDTIDQLLLDETNRVQWSALRQVRNVAGLPGIVGAAIALPDIHPGYGFPIGGIGAFDVEQGVVVVGGVGFDINCGVRLLSTPLSRSEIEPSLQLLGESLFRTVPAGLGAQGDLRLSVSELNDLLRTGAEYVVSRGYGFADDLEFTEEAGHMPNADPEVVSDRAKHRQFRQVGTLGSGNHYLEIQVVERILDYESADAYGLFQDQIVLSIHTGSRALGHQIGQDYLKEMAQATEKYGFEVPERELVCAPIDSNEGQRYLAAVACGANCAFANRQMITHLVRGAMQDVLGIEPSELRTVYDIGHNNVKFETHCVDGVQRQLLVHRKGATRAFGPDRDESPIAYRAVGHPIIVGGTMGTASYVLRGTEAGMAKTFGSGIHGAGRALSRKKAAKKFWGETVVSDLLSQGIHLWTHSLRGVAEEAPGAYKDIESVVRASTASGITLPVAKMRPLVVIKG
ncbi:RtcB family protein [Candidatus Bipolaricaulota bacterium]|nr:RtcB family protein [Candidatus Bipolaricaulota bacterium]